MGIYEYKYDTEVEYTYKLDTLCASIKNKGISEVSKLSGLSRQTIYNILNGVHEISLKNYLLLKKVVG